MYCLDTHNIIAVNAFKVWLRCRSWIVIFLSCSEDTQRPLHLISWQWSILVEINENNKKNMCDSEKRMEKKKKQVCHVLVLGLYWITQFLYLCHASSLVVRLQSLWVHVLVKHYNVPLLSICHINGPTLATISLVFQTKDDRTWWYIRSWLQTVILRCNDGQIERQF